MKPVLDDLLLRNKVQPVGAGYIDCIVRPEYLPSLAEGLKAISIRITGLTWWCHCCDENKARYGCPHGMGGPKSKYFDGWFSEMNLPLVKIQQDDVLDVINDAHKDESYRPCFTPALWLDVPDERKSE